MKIFANIIPAVKLYFSLKYLNLFKKQIILSRENGDLENERKAILGATSTWGKNVLRIFDVKLTVNGKENLPKEGPVVYAANHQGYGDIPTCCAVLDSIQFAFVAKQNLQKVPLYGRWILRIRSVLINRQDPRAALRTIEEGIGLIRQGFSLLIFPEGTRSKGGPVKDFKKGSLRLATKPGVPVVPVTIDGTYRIFEGNGGAVKKGAEVTITIHPPIPTKDLDKHEQAMLTERVQEIVESALPPECRSSATPADSGE